MSAARPSTPSRRPRAHRLLTLGATRHIRPFCPARGSRQCTIFKWVDHGASRATGTTPHKGGKMTKICSASRITGADRTRSKSPSGHLRGSLHAFVPGVAPLDFSDASVSLKMTSRWPRQRVDHGGGSGRTGRGRVGSQDGRAVRQLSKPALGIGCKAM